ncbi:hypothetical protein EFB08_19735 [Rufibacter latericius]|uniref:Uncharacterized protein n=2 Tax=Rufibacter latericius TaxID=2487040 RepID=A0A3M9MBV4_9BACT|nr:hypothetical protein EFB08_19735 [Rufibacter latericius]
MFGVIAFYKGKPPVYKWRKEWEGIFKGFLRKGNGTNFQTVESLSKREVLAYSRTVYKVKRLL